MSPSIVFGSSKGGTGKTTVVANLGVAMAQLGHEVVLLDADLMMANLGFMLGLEELKTNLQDVLAGEAQLKEAIFTGPKGVKIVPSGVSLEGIQKAKLGNLKKIADELAQKFKFLLIDAPAGLERDAIAAITMAQKLVLVVTPDIASISDAFKTRLVAERLNVDPIGVVVNRIIRKDIDIPIEEVKSALELPILATIPEDPDIRRSTALGEPVVMHSPRSTAAREFRKLASEIVRITERSER